MSVQSVPSGEDDDEVPDVPPLLVSPIFRLSSVSARDSRRCLESGRTVGGASQALETLLQGKGSFNLLCKKNLD